MSDDSRKPSDSDDFLNAMDGVERLPEARDLPRRKPRPRRTGIPTPKPDYRFDVEQFGERVEGLLRGQDWKDLRSLRTGEIPPEAEIDLHGYRERAARAATHDFVLESYEAGIRSVLIITGRGIHHETGGVLRRELPGWLIEPATAAVVLAFVSAPKEYGGPGALMVYLRRNRARR